MNKENFDWKNRIICWLKLNKIKYKFLTLENENFFFSAERNFSLKLSFFREYMRYIYLMVKNFRYYDLTWICLYFLFIHRFWSFSEGFFNFLSIGCWKRWSRNLFTIHVLNQKPLQLARWWRSIPAKCQWHYLWHASTNNE